MRKNKLQELTLAAALPSVNPDSGHRCPCLQVHYPHRDVHVLVGHDRAALQLDVHLAVNRFPGLHLVPRINARQVAFRLTTALQVDPGLLLEGQVRDCGRDRGLGGVFPGGRGLGGVSLHLLFLLMRKKPGAQAPTCGHPNRPARIEIRPRHRKGWKRT